MGGIFRQDPDFWPVRMWRLTYFFSASATTGSVKQKRQVIHIQKVKTQLFAQEKYYNWNSKILQPKYELFKLTFDLQLAADCCFSVIVHGSAGVHTSVKVTRPTDLQRADALNADLPVLGVVSNNHLVLHPLNLGLSDKIWIIRVSFSCFPAGV